MDKKSPDVRYICRISGWGFKHLAVRGWFRLRFIVATGMLTLSFNHLAVLDISGMGKPLPYIFSRGEGVVQTFQGNAYNKQV